MKKIIYTCLISTSALINLYAEQTVRIITEGKLLDTHQEKELKRELSKILEKYSPDKTPVHIEITPSYKNSTAVLDEIYQGISGFNVDASDTQKVTQAGGNPTYGEVTPGAVNKLKDEFKFSSQDTLYDLGCGVGKLLSQAFIETPIKTCIGVELSAGRVKNAHGAKKRLDHIVKHKSHVLEPEVHQNLTAKNRKLEFRHEDITKINWREAFDTVSRGGRVFIWICSTCFSQELQNNLAQIFGQLAADSKRDFPEHVGNIIILTLKDFPRHDNGDKKLQNELLDKHFLLDKKHNLDMTWSSNVTVHQYSLKK